MSDAAKKLLDDALQLPPEARAALAGRLIESLEDEVKAHELLVRKTSVGKIVLTSDDLGTRQTG